MHDFRFVYVIWVPLKYLSFYIKMEDEDNLMDGESSEIADINEENIDIEDSSIEDTTNALKEQFEKYTKETAYLKKYFALRKRCEHIQQMNEKLVNRIQQVKTVIMRYKNDRRFLMAKLDEVGDKFDEADIPAVWEEEVLYKHTNSASTTTDSKSQSQPDAATTVSHEKFAALHPMLSAISDGSHAKKVKVERDPNAPKKPANAFLLFCQKHRGNVQEQYLKEHCHDIANYELTKRLAQQWNSLEKDDKAVFFEMYEKEKERYDREMKLYAKRDGGSPSTSLRGDTVSQDDEVYRNLVAIRQELGIKSERD